MSQDATSPYEKDGDVEIAEGHTRARGKAAVREIKKKPMKGGIPPRLGGKPKQPYAKPDMIMTDISSG